MEQKLPIDMCWEVIDGLSNAGNLPKLLPRGAHSSYKCIKIVSGFEL